MNTELKKAIDEIQWWQDNAFEDNAPGCLDPAIKLKDAYLAEYDDTPIDETWLKTIGFVEGTDGTLDHLTIGDPSEVLPHTLTTYPEINSWVYGCCSIIAPSNRGQLRRLCKSLGIQLK